MCLIRSDQVSLAVPVYIAEIAPPHARGALGAVNQLVCTVSCSIHISINLHCKAITIGILFVYAIGIPLNWRTLALIGMECLFYTCI